MIARVMLFVLRAGIILAKTREYPVALRKHPLRYVGTAVCRVLSVKDRGCFSCFQVKKYAVQPRFCSFTRQTLRHKTLLTLKHEAADTREPHSGYMVSLTLEHSADTLG